MQVIRLFQSLRFYETAVICLLLFCFIIIDLAVPVKAQQTQGGTYNQNVVADLSKRIGQLEEQLVDLQVVLGTLETLAKGQIAVGVPSQSAASPIQGTQGANSSDQVRITALETQVLALSQKLQQLSGQTKGAAPSNTGSPSKFAAQSQWSDNTRANESSLGGFGETTVNPRGPASSGDVSQRNLPQFSDAGSGQADPQAEYEAAYGFLLQQDYGAAQTAFANFVNKHNGSPLAGNAQYWLGETFYLQGQYKRAAGAFLKGYRTYANSPKAPDSLLKLAMSLDRLGQRSSACASLTELGNKYQNAPQHLLLRAKQEIRRLRC